MKLLATPGSDGAQVAERFKTKLPVQPDFTLPFSGADAANGDWRRNGDDSNERRKENLYENETN